MSASLGGSCRLSRAPRDWLWSCREVGEGAAGWHACRICLHGLHYLYFGMIEAVAGEVRWRAGQSKSCTNTNLCVVTIVSLCKFPCAVNISRTIASIFF